MVGTRVVVAFEVVAGTAVVDGSVVVGGGAVVVVGGLDVACVDGASEVVVPRSVVGGSVGAAVAFPAGAAVEVSAGAISRHVHNPLSLGCSAFGLHVLKQAAQLGDFS